MGAAIVITLYTVHYVANSKLFQLRQCTIEGSNYLKYDEIISLMEVKKSDNLLFLDSKQLARRLMASPWIRKAFLRKELPHTLLVRIEETQPVALLMDKNEVYLVDDKGEKLERQNDALPVLPVIAVENSDEKIYLNAVKLSEEINNNAFLRGEAIEIRGTKPENISMNINGTTVLVGTGEYKEKLNGFLKLKDEVDKRNIEVEYIDVRFTKRLIVKPVKRKIGREL